MALWLPDNTTPTYQTGYLTPQGEEIDSRQQLRALWDASLGVTGTTLRNQSKVASAFDGQFVNMSAATAWTMSEMGYGLTFTGSPDRILVDNLVSDVTADHPITMAGWFRINTEDIFQTLISHCQDSGGGTEQVKVAVGINDSNQLGITIQNSLPIAVSENSQAIVAGRWYHFAAIITHAPAGSVITAQSFLNGIPATPESTCVRFATAAAREQSIESLTVGRHKG